MNTIEEVLAFNQTFVEEKRYEQFETDKYPEKKLAVLSCMDTRLTELLPAALGLKNGDAKIIKNAGGVIAHPFGSVIRSLLVAIFELGVENIMVVGHSNCGAQHMNAEEMISHMLDAVFRATISNCALLRHRFRELARWIRRWRRERA